MTSHYELTDEQFELAFENCSLPADLFTHEAHLRLAWIHIKKYGVDAAITNISSQIIGFVTHLGAQDKYHQTVTTAAVKMVNHYVMRSEMDDFQSFISQFPTLAIDFKGMLSCHYSFDVFESDQAKSVYLEPDLKGFN